MKLRQLVVVALLLSVAPSSLARVAVAQEATANEGRALSDLSVYPTSKGGTPGFAPLPKGTVFRVLDERDGRYRVSAGGWVRVAGVELLASPKPAEPKKEKPPAPAPKPGGELEGRALSDLSIYPTAVGGMPGMAPLQKGKVFKILDEKNGRYRVSTGGWVNAKGVELLGAEPAKESTGLSDAVGGKPAKPVGGALEGRAVSSLSIYPTSSGGTPGFAPLAKGTEFKILDEKDGRYRISTGGWVSVKGVEVLK